MKRTFLLILGLVTLSLTMQSLISAPQEDGGGELSPWSVGGIGMIKYTSFMSDVENGTTLCSLLLLCPVLLSNSF